MSRAQRLLELLQMLREHKRPVAGTKLADALGISIRTLYRDIDTLRAQGAIIDGEPGLGYALSPGYMLPPLMFTDTEIEALVLGSRWITERADDDLADAARGALAKIAAVLPKDLQVLTGTTNLLVGPSAETAGITVDLAEVRRAIRDERKTEIVYADGKGQTSSRIIWPFALSFFDHVRIVAAWCELRQSFRHFRADRISMWRPTKTRIPHRRQALLKEWRSAEGIPEQ